MQVIKYMEEGILGLFFSGKLMHIVDNQDINHLVKMQEIIFIVVPDGIHKLGLELIGIYIEDNFLRE